MKLKGAHGMTQWIFRPNIAAKCAAFWNIVIALGTVILAVLICVALIEVNVVLILIVSLIVLLLSNKYSRLRAGGFAR